MGATGPPASAPSAGKVCAHILDLQLGGPLEGEQLHGGFFALSGLECGSEESPVGCVGNAAEAPNAQLGRNVALKVLWAWPACDQNLARLAGAAARRRHSLMGRSDFLCRLPAPFCLSL